MREGHQHDGAVHAVRQGDQVGIRLSHVLRQRRWHQGLVPGVCVLRQRVEPEWGSGGDGCCVNWFALLHGLAVINPLYLFKLYLGINKAKLAYLRSLPFPTKKNTPHFILYVLLFISLHFFLPNFVCKFIFCIFKKTL